MAPIVLFLQWSVRFSLSANVQPIVFAFLSSGGKCFSMSSHGAWLQHSIQFQGSTASTNSIFFYSVAPWWVSLCSFLLCMKSAANRCLCSVYFMVSCFLFGLLRASKPSISYFLLQLVACHSCVFELCNLR
jgi:hypothetical protein